MQMARGGRFPSRRNTRNKVKLEERGSDMSDEDYLLSEDEFDDSDDEYCSSIAYYETKESFGGFAEEEEEEGSVLFKQESDDNLCDGKTRKKIRASSSEKCLGQSKMKAIVSYRDEDTEEGESDEDFVSDEEFTPDEVDGADDDDDEQLSIGNKNKEESEEGQIANGKKRKRNVDSSRTSKRKKPKKEQVSRKNNTYRGKEFEDESSVAQRKRKFTRKCGRRKTNSNSTLGLSLKISRRERQEKKGKEKVVDPKIEIAKRVCGICLSEEGKSVVRGILNCCSHYFCFACIMEWSKVESRCPLCKQRFVNITRTARASGGHDLKNAVILIPERDQVYQPSEEELLNLYENLRCSECHQGGLDEFLLLCDLCDSPAHTFCVGLGHEVPQGNWYCDACGPTALASPDARAPGPTTDDHGQNNNASVRRTLDLNEADVPETPLTGHSSPRYESTVDSFSGLEAVALYERRQTQDHPRRQRDDDVASVSGGISLFGSRIPRVAPPQQDVHLHRQIVYNYQGRSAEYVWYYYFYPNWSSLRRQELNRHDSTSTNFGLGRLWQVELFRDRASASSSWQ